LCPELPPRLIIARLQVGCLELLAFGDNHGHQADRAAYHDTRNRAASPGGSALMRTGHAKTMLQVIVGAWQIWHVIALKQTSSKVLGDLHEMIDGCAQFA